MAKQIVTVKVISKSYSVWRLKKWQFSGRRLS